MLQRQSWTTQPHMPLQIKIHYSTLWLL